MTNQGERPEAKRAGVPAVTARHGQFRSRARTAIAAIGVVLFALVVDVRGGEDVSGVSLVQLLATPERYEGRRVRVFGYCRLEFEERALYLHKEDSDTLNAHNGVWLDIDDGLASASASLNGEFAVVEGTFTDKIRGHFGAWPAALTKLSRLDRAPKRSDFEKQRRQRKLR